MWSLYTYTCTPTKRGDGEYLKANIIGGQRLHGVPPILQPLTIKSYSSQGHPLISGGHELAAFNKTPPEFM